MGGNQNCCIEKSQLISAETPRAVRHIAWHGYSFSRLFLDTTSYFAQVGGKFEPNPDNYSVIIVLAKQRAKRMQQRQI